MKNVKNLGMACGLIGLLLVGCGNVKEESVIKETEVVEEITQEQKEEVIKELLNENYKLNEKVNVEYNGGTAEVVFTNVYFTDYRNEFADEQPDKVLVVEYTYTNVDFVPEYGNGLYFMHGIDYNIYDEDNLALELYPYYTDMAQEVGIGRSSKGSESFSVYGQQTHFEIELYDGKIVEFDLE